MKAKGLFRAVVLVAIFIVSGTNSFMKAQEKNFVTNEEVVNNIVKSRTVYRLSEGTLYHHMKYDFTYDDQNRMTSREAFKWDAQNNSWSPFFMITYTYSEKEMAVQYARWNQKSKSYDLAMEKSVYELNKENIPVAYYNYKWKDFYWEKELNQFWAMDNLKDVPEKETLSCRVHHKCC